MLGRPVQLGMTAGLGVLDVEVGVAVVDRGLSCGPSSWYSQRDCKTSSCRCSDDDLSETSDIGGEGCPRSVL